MKVQSRSRREAPEKLMPIVNSSQRRSLVPRPIAKAWPPQVPPMKSSLRQIATRAQSEMSRSGDAADAGRHPVLNSFSFDACIETLAHLRFAPPTSAASPHRDEGAVDLRTGRGPEVSVQG